MIGMFEQMLAEMLRRKQEQEQRPHGGMLEQESVFAPRRGLPPRNFRDPSQGGPSPGPISKMFGSPIVRGNIDVLNRPRVVNADGSASSVRSMSFGEGGREILVPTVSEDARILSDDEAIDQYRRTGRHLGMFDTPDSATAYAGRLHDQQESLGDMRALSAGDMGPDARRARRRTAPVSDGRLSMMLKRGM
jgi:hypothetical protein